MFDWDRDYDSVVERSAAESGIVIHAEPAVSAPAPGRVERLTSRLRGAAGRSLMAVAVVLGLGAAGSTALLLQDAPSLYRLQAALAVPLQFLGLDDSAMPAELIAYDQTQYDNFRHGIARFSDTDLAAYARSAEATLAGDSALEAFTRDALFLTYREMERRGLVRPTASLAGFYRQL